MLAGGDGVRLRSLTRRLHGDDRPKQYAVLFGSRSLLHQTLDRVALAVPGERTVVVTVRNHARYIAAELAGLPVPRARTLVQPVNRGTAAGVLFPAYWISWRDPEAVVAVFPSDHFIDEEAVFMEHVVEVASVVNHHGDRIVLLGARPTEPETDYGWIAQAEEPLEWTSNGPLRRVRRFWKKPSIETARECLLSGCLWNTLVVVAKASALVETSRRLLPDLHDRLSRIAPFADTEDEPWAVHQAYQFAPRLSFSRSILEACPPGLTVSTLPTCTWSDLGTPARVVKSLKQARVLPGWLTELDLLA